MCAFCSRAVSSKIKVKLVSAEVVGGIERASSILLHKNRHLAKCVLRRMMIMSWLSSIFNLP